MKLCRVQDLMGRGPYRPGLSHRWADPDGPDNPPWWVEIGETIDVAVRRLQNPDMHYGSAFASIDHLAAWFTKKDRRKLDRLGFKMVRFEPHEIIVETPTQVVFSMKGPLSAIRDRASLLRLPSA